MRFHQTIVLQKEAIMKLNKTMTTIVILLCGIACAAQTLSTPSALQTYSSTEKRVTELDWNLLQFNLLWHDSYGDGEYVKSFPLFFDYESMTFKARLRVTDKRDYLDPEPFLSLPVSRQQAILQGVTDYLLDLLSKNFPRVTSIQRYVEITFEYIQTGGGSSTVGTYRDGRLILLTR